MVFSWAQGKLFHQISPHRVGNRHHVATLINSLNFLLLHPAVKAGAVPEIGGREYAVQTEPDVTLAQRPAAGDDTVGFVQVGEHKVKLPLLFGPDDRGVQLAGAAGQLGQLAPRFTAAIGNYLVVEPLGQWVLADIAQRNERHSIAVAQELCRQGQDHFFRAAAG